MRRTKEESAHTRQQILAAARDMFARRGVTRTSLEQIAKAAGVTRGAIYWHFSNKTALFYAMREQVLLPCLDRVDLALLQADLADPLVGIERLSSLADGRGRDAGAQRHCEADRRAYRRPSPRVISSRG